ncbi:TonB-dependent siderophore receptor [Testudinibacter sp. TR-2022]|uniref:TonB-dependent siderophore receptor n=1 Tax=Testudinibacter sp. TR-2022 TaxID=2585029 RepID=UPI00111B23E1|nr:TonB-dependent siderophore receptor [Testudinibacter sp. TR-2022]TNH07884.1 TonB-dependent siderophore receptor [Pasteurellaceae bacterium Phil11]TNH24674.1 TonB-dependent siderophore receptor [Testudinibacter sp. TR-2022]TNH28162.1 TonB-dependent siderophore receptor [Testudinibacter sp. TR-2022]
MKFLKRQRYFKRSAVALSLLSCIAQAENKQELETITVTDTSIITESSYNQGYGAYGSSTATGLAMTLRQTPQNVSIVSAEQIKDQNLSSLSKVVQQAVGLYADVKGSTETGYTVLYARGNRVQNFQLDGMPMNNIAFGGKGPGDEPNAWSILNSAQYDQIEVLRGATALMDGSGQPSATISLHRKRPTRHFQGTLDFKVGDFNLHGVETDLSGSLNADSSLRGRLVMSYLGSDTFRERAQNRNGMIYGITEWNISSDTTLSIGGTYQSMRDRNTSMFGLVLYDTDGNAIPASPRSNATINGSYVNYSNLNLFTELRHRFNQDWLLKIEYGYAKGHRDQVAGIAASAFVNRTIPMAAGATVKSDEHPRQHNFMASLNGKYTLWNRKHDVMFGVSGYILNNDQPRYGRQLNRIFDPSMIDNLGLFNGVLPLPLWAADGQDINRIRQVGAYTATRLYLTEQLALILGGRYTRFNITEDTQYIQNGKNTKSSVTPYIGLVYDLNDNFSIYSSYAQIFKPQTKRDKNNQYLNPEKGSNIEVGLKAEFFDGRLNGSLALFETRKRNVGFCEQYSPGGLTCDYYAFDPSGKTKGFEIEVNGEIRDNWAISAGFSRSKGKGSNNQRLTPEIPIQQFKIFTSYAWRSMTVGAGVRWQSTIYEGTPWGLNYGASAALAAKAKAVSTQKSYALVDLMLRYNLSKNATLTLNVENLFDKIYRTSVNSHSYGSPRNINMTLGFKF